MDLNKIGQSFGAGLALGVSVVAFTTFIFLPASYAMNRFVYHPPVMRLLLAIAAGIGSIVSFLILLGVLVSRYINNQAPIHYFGMLPLIQTGSPIEPSGFFAFIFKIINFVIHPLMFYYLDDEDKEGYIATLRHLIVDDKDKDTNKDANADRTVVERLFEESRRVSRLAGSNYSEWANEMDKLSNPCMAMFVGENR